jgi:hypothetical protein
VSSLPASTPVTATNTYIYVIAPKTATIRVYDPNLTYDITMKTFDSSDGDYTNAITEVGDYKLYRSTQVINGEVTVLVQQAQ